MIHVITQRFVRITSDLRFFFFFVTVTNWLFIPYGYLLKRLKCRLKCVVESYVRCTWSSAAITMPIVRNRYWLTREIFKYISRRPPSLHEVIFPTFQYGIIYTVNHAIIQEPSNFHIVVKYTYLSYNSRHEQLFHGLIDRIGPLSMYGRGIIGCRVAEPVFENASARTRCIFLDIPIRR